jgi:TRAP-type uncharacterized transport system fused permease subunit|tara:strand:- start:617 stop:1963 length:1347 start_codon:yes stop_codon:yes gene_type:complete
MKNLNLIRVFLTCILLLGAADVESHIGLALYDEQKNIIFIWTALAIAFPKFSIPLLLGGFGLSYFFPYFADVYVDNQKIMVLSFAIPLLLFVIIGSFKTNGKAFTGLLITFLLLPFVYNGTGQDYKDIIVHLAIDSTAMLGMILNIITGMVFLFVALGIIVLNTGLVDLIIKYVLKYVKSPGRIAILSSSIFGSVSGSALANVMSTGQVTIPLMKSVGYSPRLAAAYESVASTGGQLLPPIMGAAAFIMAELLNIGYWDVVYYASLPAVAFYLLLLIKCPKGEVKTNYEPRKLQFPDAKVCAEKIGEAMHGMIILGAGIGCMIGILDQTGLVYLITDILLTLSDNSTTLLLIVTALLSIILGLGMPTGAAYVVVALITAPALIDAGFTDIWAHMFVLYFATLSMISPPVAIASYGAAKIADSNPITTSLTSMYVAWPLYVIPFIFIWF